MAAWLPAILIMLLAAAVSMHHQHYQTILAEEEEVLVSRNLYYKGNTKTSRQWIMSYPDADAQLLRALGSQ